MSAYSLSVCIVSMSLVTCQNGLLFSRLSSCLSAVSRLFTLAGNGLGIGEEGEFENLQSNICTKVDSSTTDQLLPSAPFLPIPCSSDTSGEIPTKLK